RTYVDGTYDSIEALSHLLAYGERRPGRELMVFFFGEHLPALGNHFAFYKQSGWVESSSMQKWDPQEWARMHTTTYVAYSSRGRRFLQGDLAVLHAGRKVGDTVGLRRGPLDEIGAALEN